jgi:hypothetical protein
MPLQSPTGVLLIGLVVTWLAMSRRFSGADASRMAARVRSRMACTSQPFLFDGHGTKINNRNPFHTPTLPYSLWTLPSGGRVYGTPVGLRRSEARPTLIPILLARPHTNSTC